VSSAGGSARREYHRRRDARARDIRSRHPRVGGFILAVTDEPQSTKAWATGATGEEETGRWLDRLASAGAVRVLHDRRIPRLRSNIDHIVIAPGGVFVVDSKRYHGRVERRVTGSIFHPGPTNLYVGGRDRTSLASGVQKQLDAVSVALAGLGRPDVDMAGVLLFTTGDFSLFAKPFRIDGVEVHWPRSLSKRLKQPGPHSVETIAAIHQHLGNALPPA
jgi:hypothetical protein